MPSDSTLKRANAVHRAMLKVSGGRIGWRAAKMPVLRLTTIGRKSGQARSVMLTSPHQVGDSYVVVASRGGDDVNPAWFLNLQANPHVTVTMRATADRVMVARVASADERVELWPIITKSFKNYANYQTKTSREIPVVILDPVQ